MIMKTSRKVNPMISGVLIGVCVSLSLMVLLSLFVSWLVHTEKAGLPVMSTAAAVIQFISVFSGCMVAMQIGKGKIAVTSAATAAITFIILLCTALMVFSEGVPNFVSTMVIMAVAGTAACLLKLKFGTQKKFHKKRRFR